MGQFPGSVGVWGRARGLGATRECDALRVGARRSCGEGPRLQPGALTQGMSCHARSPEGGPCLVVLGAVTAEHGMSRWGIAVDAALPGMGTSIRVDARRSRASRPCWPVP